MSKSMRLYILMPDSNGTLRILSYLQEIKMKKLFLIFLMILIVKDIALGGESSKLSLGVFSVSTSQVEFDVNDISKPYVQPINISSSIDADNWEVFLEIDIHGIPKDRILIALGPNPMDNTYSPVNNQLKIVKGKGKGNFSLPTLNIKYVPNWQDKPGRYDGTVRILYRIDSARETISGPTIPITINIQPVLIITVWTEPRNSENLEVSFRAPSPGEWDSREKLWFLVGTNYNSWNLQCKANPLIHEKYSNKLISPEDLFVRVNRGSYKSMANPVIVSSGSGGTQITVGPIEFRLKVTPLTMAGDYTGNLEFTFFGTPR